MGANARHHQKHDVGECHTERDLQHSLGTAPVVSVNVHSLSVRAGKPGFKLLDWMCEPISD